MTTKEQVEDDLNYVNKVLAETGKESDRAAAVLICAEIDNAVVRLLENYLLPPVKKSSRFLEQDGPLGPFSARIEAVYRLGLIPPVFHHDLQIMRSIRNDFAHGKSGLSFASNRISDLCKNLLIAEDFRTQQIKELGTVPEGFMKDAKSRFMMTSSILLAHLTLLKFQVGRTPEHWTRFFNQAPPPQAKSSAENSASDSAQQSGSGPNAASDRP